MWLGLKPADPLYVTLARICTALYFGFFILLPQLRVWTSPRRGQPAEETD